MSAAGVASADELCATLALVRPDHPGDRDRELLSLAAQLAGVVAEGDDQPPRAALARSLAAMAIALSEGRVNPAYGVPLAVSGAHTLKTAIRDGLALGAVEAARYEIDTLLPLPGPANSPSLHVDVPADQLKRRTKPDP